MFHVCTTEDSSQPVSSSHQTARGMHLPPELDCGKAGFASSRPCHAFHQRWVRPWGLSFVRWTLCPFLLFILSFCVYLLPPLMYFLFLPQTLSFPLWYHVYSPPSESSPLTPHLWFKVSHLKESFRFVVLWVPRMPSGRWVWLPWAHSFLCWGGDPTRLNSVSSPPWACHALASEREDEIKWLKYLGRQTGFKCGSGRCLFHHPAEDQPLCL